MPSVNRIRPKIGDVIEIPTVSGLAYAHYTHKHTHPPKYGALLNILPGIHKSRPNDFSKVVLQKPQFITFFPLNAACNRGIVNIVASEEIPEHAQAFPTFRSCIKSTNGNGPWWLWDGKTEWQVGKLERGMESLPLRGILNDKLLVERIISGWHHELDI